MVTQGIRLSGTIEVEVGALAVDMQVPLLAMPFTGWIGGILARALAERARIRRGLGRRGSGRRPVGRVRDDPGTDPQRPVVLFLHIPKAGGTTLSDYVFAQCHTPGGETTDC